MNENLLKDIDKGYHAQRRSLVIMSIVTLLYDTAEISFAKFNVFGSEIKINNPNNITLAIWLVFMYFLLRYYQYFREIPDRGIRDMIHGKAARYHERLALRRALARFKAQHPGYKKYDPKRKDYVWLNLNLKLIKVKSPVLMSKDREATEVDMDENVQLPFVEKAIGYASATLYVCVTTRLVTEYYFPFVLAALPICHGAYRLLV